MGIEESKPINILLSEKIKRLFESNTFITNYELNTILSSGPSHSIEFSDLQTFFCWDYKTFKNNDSLIVFLKNTMGENFVEFIQSSNFFKIKTNKTNKSNEIEKKDISFELIKSDKENFEENKENNNKENNNSMFDLMKLKLIIFLFSCDYLDKDNNYNDKVNKLFN
jgi:hypothetical protein